MCEIHQNKKFKKPRKDMKKCLRLFIWYLRIHRPCCKNNCCAFKKSASVHAKMLQQKMFGASSSLFWSVSLSCRCIKGVGGWKKWTRFCVSANINYIKVKRCVPFFVINDDSFWNISWFYWNFIFRFIEIFISICAYNKIKSMKLIHTYNTHDS